ncbi:MAG: class I SAM-dependent methyltransferase [Candidatus Neomarinimicrobiota bacterium]
MNQIRDIYAAPELYDALHWWKNNDCDFIAGWAEKSGSPVLELAAGTGRLAQPILARGLNYTGLELSPEYARVAAAKLAPFGDRARIVRGDMRDFHLGREFKFIFIGFNSFLHLYRDEDALACLRCIREHLAVGGRLLIDMFVPDPSFLYREAGVLYDVASFHHPLGGYCTIRETNDYDEESEINHVDWYFYRPLARLPERFSFDMRIYYPDTMDRMLTDAGLAILEKYGDRAGTPFGPDSELQIYICGDGND